MKRSITLAALVLTSTLALTACSDATDNSDDADTTSTTTATAETNETHQEDTTTADEEHGGHDHPADGGAPPAGIEEAEDPTYPVGTEVILTADHMPGMDGATATISGAFDTTTYSVSYTPAEGGARLPTTAGSSMRSSSIRVRPPARRGERCPGCRAHVRHEGC